MMSVRGGENTLTGYRPSIGQSFVGYTMTEIAPSESPTLRENSRECAVSSPGSGSATLRTAPLLEDRLRAPAFTLTKRRVGGRRSSLEWTEHASDRHAQSRTRPRKAQ